MDSLYLRYSNALLDIAISENKLEEYKSSLSWLDEYFTNHLDIKKYLESYMVNKNEKEELIKELTKPFKLNNLSNFLCVLIKNHRFHDFGKFNHEFRKLANENLGIIQGLVFSVNYLSKEDLQRVEDKLTKKLNKKVELENRLDESLIGGIKVFINDHVYDGSVKGKLDQMNHNLKERRNA